MSKRLTTVEFIDRACVIHGDAYDYSEVEYVTNSIKVTIICSIHGKFEQIPNSHLLGRGCNKCGGTSKSNTNNFINTAIKTHGGTYNYSKVEYINNRSKIIISCPIHGEFIQSPNDHLTGYGCPKCSGKNKTTEDFILQAGEVHDNKYDYSEVNYTLATDKVDIICSEHGIFKQRPSDHLSGYGCPTCKESRGEKAIRQYLNKCNINYTTQHKFSDCKHINSLPFDFYLPDHNLLVEYDGKQHFEPIEYFGGVVKFEEQQRNDNIKNKFINNNELLSLLRIPYTDIHNIDIILNKNIT